MKKKRNIIYLCHAEKGPSGGAKVTYHHSEIVNTFKNTSSEVIHLQKKKLSKWKNSLNKKLGIKRKYSGWLIQDVEVKKNFKFPWFDSKIKISNSLNFSKNDFIILPDIFAHLAKELCIKKKINYAIFAQNGYALESTNNHKILNEVYKKAEFILTYSDHMIESVLNLFPFCKKKIIKLKMRIEASLKNKILKKNIITYMPRKLPGHSSKLIFFLKNKLPKNWRILPLHNMSQNEVYKNLMKSKIFLSFSYFDSLGLPPLEAALLGNKVIGYTGEGGKEYWKKPIFTEIYSGELFKFVDEILKEIKNKSFLKKSRKFRNKLKKNYSKDEEIKYLKKFVYKICQ
tara:strand:- start:739 stop:1767 length:1029 start_codon:yes stop_codon:yes gene_type:complete